MDKNTQVDNKPTASVVLKGKVESTNQKSIKRIVLTMMSFFLVPALIAAGYLVYKDKTNIDTNQLNKLIAADDCSSKEARSTNSYKLNPKNVNATILLLQYRSTCQYQAGHYQQVVSIDRQLQSYYSKKNDTTDATSVAQQIQAVQYVLVHPSASLGPDASPQDEQYNKALSGQ